MTKPTAGSRASGSGLEGTGKEFRRQKEEAQERRRSVPMRGCLNDAPTSGAARDWYWDCDQFAIASRRLLPRKSWGRKSLFGRGPRVCGWADRHQLKLSVDDGDGGCRMARSEGRRGS